ncbi:DNA-binding transcriptional regulator, MocR family, contains an aminotransferase domain [Enhydrobacter aerosaccus]|uniref:DNA-binding transcriptional regulator, MocR family, contains an aminotransferase domain n=1 Tax=Enhydrobacter aerosaccus TaxID=225324 RepID=A0A1T4N9J8_9HYPH|nr:PLP-dependent aminotransferase family protein [Enhydrobacter aerosaccus]SJZ75773.1 DNA-binding transcriptional regulator, MocR family, contains an aminotransferase domain [Enhydrobacter aerosaccus]
MDWRPTLNDRRGPVYEGIVEALAADIASGRLHRGQRLPTHRALAQALGIDLTTVTRAYGEAHRRGLTEARVGQGTFVAESRLHAPRAAAAGIEFDLSMNLPPEPVEADLEGRIMRGLQGLQRDYGLSDFMSYQPAGGSEQDRAVAATWLKRRVATAHADTLLVLPGTQTALMCLLLTLTKPGDVVLADRLTYPGFKAAAVAAKVRLVGVDSDRGGMSPAALEEACKRHAAKAVYLIPTIHNPTTTTLSASRREQLAAVIRRRGLLLFEDDAYGSLDPRLAPITTLVPECGYLAASLSKCIAPGLRVSFLLSPDRTTATALANTARAVAQMPVPLTVALALRWLADGSADAIIAAIAAEAAARQKLAARALAGLDYKAHPKGHHLWLTLPSLWNRMEFAAYVQRQGLAVVTSDSFSVDGVPEHAIRIALGAARSQADLSAALDLLAVALKAPASASRIV